MTCPQCEKLRAALLGMCCQFCSPNGDKLHHLFQSDAEEAFELLGIENGMTLADAWSTVEAAAPSPLQSVITRIPVSERLPEPYKDVLIWQYAPDQQTFNKMGPHVVVAYYNAAASRWMCFVANDVVGTVTHWAELPPPPASEEETG